MAKQSPKQREIVSRVMREFKEGDLESSAGHGVKNPRQAIALHEAGASRGETPAGNRRNVARTKAKERQAEAGRTGGGGSGGDETRAALYAEATKRGIPGRSRMAKAQLIRALDRQPGPAAIRENARGKGNGRGMIASPVAQRRSSVRTWGNLQGWGGQDCSALRPDWTTAPRRRNERAMDLPKASSRLG